MRSFIVALAALAMASSAEATRLFATTNTGLYEIDPSTAATHFVAPLNVGSLPFADISGRAGDDSHLFGVRREGGPTFRNIVASIDVGSGLVTELFDFFPADLGLGANQLLEMTGISISTSLPSTTATIMATVLDFSVVSVQTLVFDLDLGTGAVSNLVTVPNNDSASGLTEAPDGSLFSLKSLPTEFRPATVDRSTAQLGELPFGFCASAPPFCSDGAIEFDPNREELLIVERGGELVRLSASTGEILGVIGTTGQNIVYGLAFVPVPEPGTGVLLAIGLVAYGLGSNGRGGSRQTSRRA